MSSKQTKPGLAKSAGSSPAQPPKAAPLIDPQGSIQELQQTMNAFIQEQNIKFQMMADQNKKIMADQKKMFEQMMDALTIRGKQQEETLINRVEDALLKMSKDVQEGFKLVSNRVEELEEKVIKANTNTEAKISEIQERVDGTEDEMTMMQYRAMEFAIRVRGLKESNREDLKAIVTEIFASVLGAQSTLVSAQIDKIYRVNSWVARQRQLPRDVVVYFTTRCFRNEILQAFFKDKFQVAGRELLILKEIPPKMLRTRKNYAFLTDELKKRQIQFRWDIPEGVILNYLGARHRLNTVEKARVFFDSVLRAEQQSSSSPGGRRRQAPDKSRKETQQLEIQTQVQDVEMSASGFSTIGQELTQMKEPLEQRGVAIEKRLTRLAKKKMEEVMLQQSQMQATRTEAVGGVTVPEDLFNLVLQVLQGDKDGN